MHNMEQSDGDCASWDAIRTLIAECPDLSQDAVQSLIAQGDEAAVIAGTAGDRRDSQNATPP